MVHVLVSSHRASAFPNSEVGRHSTNSPHNDFCTGIDSRGYSHFLMFRPPGLLATQVVPTAEYVITTIPWAAVTFTSTHISVCYLPEQWIC